MELFFALAAFLVAGIAQADANPLVGTSWQLHAIQSMDDAQGTTKVADPSHFTLEFGREAALRCASIATAAAAITGSCRPATAPPAR